jgi:hypothetical protein
MTRLRLQEMTMHILVRFFSILGFFVQGFIFCAAFGAAGLSDADQEHNSAWTIFLLPLVYFAFCFISSFRRIKGTLLLISGVVAHLIIIPFYARAVRDGIGILLAIPLILAPCWFYMCLEKNHPSRP